MKSKCLSLILAGSILVSLAGCRSSDTGADASASTPDVASASVSTPEREPAPAPTPDVAPAPVSTPDQEPVSASTPDEEPSLTSMPDEEPAPASTPDEEPPSAPDSKENAGPSLDDLIQLTEQALSQGDLNHEVSTEGGGIAVSVWMDGLGYALSAAISSGFSVESAVQAAGGEFLVLLERNILELAGAAGYEDMPVTLRVLDDRDLEQVLFVISDGELTVSES